MNYSGKFDAKLAADGASLDSNGHPHAHVETITQHATHVPAGAIIVPDAQLLFNGDFKRSGVDLVLSKDSQELVLHDYFKGEKRAALSSPDGAHLTGDLVNALTGHVDYAQADGSASVGKVIGHVTKLVGTATAIRNGVSITLNNGDNVEKGDVVSSGSDSTVGITFIDGTVFGLSSNARMVLNEMVYDPNGSNNSSLLSLVAGTITFVAGETAKHGDMKVDTPVATMGIRGTAVLAELPSLIEIDFNVPAQGGVPAAKFQVLVEPDGTTGSYILFDKQTLMPLVTIDTAGKYVAFANGQMSTGNALFSPEVQKLITDVFAQKFTDNTNQTTKTASSSTGSSTSDTTQLTKTAAATDTSAHTDSTNNNGAAAKPDPKSPTAGAPPNAHIPGEPLVAVSKFAGVQITELASKTGDSSDKDITFGNISFNDINVGDTPTATVTIDQNAFTYKDAHGNDITPAVHNNAQWLADVKAVEVDLVLVPDPGNTNFGTVSWTYSVSDNAFDFLAAGETLTLTYVAHVNNNFAPLLGQEIGDQSFTIVITGSNDTPVITTDQLVQHIAFTAGTSTTGGPLISPNATSGTFAFTDTDLTDTHTVATALTSATLSGPGAPTLDLKALEALAPAPMAAFEKALTASIVEPTDDSTGTGAGTINWQLANLPVFLADFIPKGETLTLDYTVTVTDSQGATDTKTVEVTIVGADANAEVWIRTTTAGVPNTLNGLWTNGQNWETGLAPVAADDVIIITDQLHALTPGAPDPIPSYPVTIDATTQAAANSVTMDDFSSTPPELDILAGGSLTIGAAANPGTHNFILNADSILHNSGTLTVVDGKMELSDRLGAASLPNQLNQSVVVNSGTINLEQGGDFQGRSNITNTGKIDVQGGTLNVLVNITNTSPGQIIVDSGATVALGTDTNNDPGIVINSSPGIVGGITGGTVTVNTGGTLDLQGNNFLTGGHLGNSGQVNVTGTGNALHNETVTANHALEVFGGAALTLDQGTTVANSGTITVDSTGALTLNAATISGGTINDFSAGSPALGGLINVTGDSKIDSSAALNNGAVTVQSGKTLTLDNVTVTGTSFTDTGTVAVDGGATLTLDHATIDGGTVTNTASTIDLIGGDVLKNGHLGNAGQINVSGLNALHSETVTANTALEILAGGALTLDQGTTVANSGTITVDSTGTLTLNAATISGGTINDFTAGSPALGGLINVTGDSKIDSNAALNNGAVTVQSGKTLTLDNVTVTGTSFTDTGTVLVDGGATLTLDHATIDGGTVTNTASTIDLIGGDVLKNGHLGNAGQINVSGLNNALHSETVTANTALEILTGGALTLDQGTTVANSGGTVTIDGTGTLTLNGASITSGTLGNSGTLNATTGTNALHGIALTNTSTGTLESTGGGTLTIDNSTVTFSNAGLLEANGGELDLTSDTLTNTGTLKATGGGVLKLISTAVTNFLNLVSGTVAVDSASALTLTDSSISGGKLTNSGTISSSGTSSLSGVTTTNNSVLDVASGKLTATNGSISNAGTIEVQGGTLDLESLAVTNTSASGSLVQVDLGATLDLGNASISGGKLTNSGTVSSSGTSSLSGVTTTNNSVLDVASGKLTATNGSISNAGTIEVQGGTLDLESLAVTNTSASGSLVQVDLGATLDLGNASVSGGKLTNSGTVSSSGTSALSNVATTNNSVLDVASGKLTATNGSISNAGTIEVQGGTLDLESLAVTNTSASGSLVQVDLGATLDLGSASISGGKLTNSGTVSSSGTSALCEVATTNNSVLDVASGKLTATNGSISNAGTIEVQGGTLDLESLAVTNTSASGSLVQVDLGATLDLGNASISGGKLTNSGTVSSSGTSALSNVATTNNSVLDVASGKLTATNGSISNAGTIEVQGGTLDLESLAVTNTSASGSLVQVDLGATLDLGNASISGGKLTNSGTVSSSGTSALSNVATTNNSVLDVASGKLTATNGSISNAGTIEVQGGTLDLESLAVTNTSASGSLIQVDLGATLDLGSASISGGKLTNSGTVSSSGTSSLSGVTTTNNSVLDVASGKLTATNGSISNAGTIEVQGGTLDLESLAVTNTSASGSLVQVDLGATLDLGNASVSGGKLTNSGTVDTTGTSSLSGSQVTNTGTVEILNGALKIIGSGSVSGTGSIQIDHDAVLELNATVSADQNIVFHGANAELQIDGASMGGKITGADATDELDLQSIPYGPDTTATYQNGVLHVTDGHGHSIDLNLTLAGDYPDPHFAGSSDGTPSGTLITLNANDDKPVIAAADVAKTAVLTEVAGQTGATSSDVSTPPSGTIHFTDIDLTDRPTAPLAELTQTATYLAADGTTALTLTSAELAAIKNAFSISAEAGNTNNGAIDWSYSVTDNSLDFLAVGETVKLLSTVTVDDHEGGTAAATVTITITGTNDAPVIAADASGTGGTGLHSVTERAGLTNAPVTTTDVASGSLSFTDVDLTDTHTVSQAAPTYVWSGGALTAGQTAALTAAASLVLTESDSTHSGSGSIGFNYTAADNSFDFLAAGETLKVTYQVTVADLSNGVLNGTSSTQPVTITITGTNDAPVIAADASGTGGTGLHSVTERAGLTNAPVTTTDVASGSLSFTDVDLTDTHTVSQAAPTYVWSGGALTAGQTAALTAAASLVLTESDSTHSGSGSIGFNYTAADNSFDFLAAGETLKVTYQVTVADLSNGVLNGTSSTQPVTITITGTNDAPVIAADASGTGGTGLHSVTERAGLTNAPVTTTDVASGSLSFTDVDLTDTHTVSQAAPTYVWSGGALTAGQTAALTAAASLVLTESDSTHSGSGSIGFNYTAADNSFDFLAAGETLKVTYQVTVADLSNGVLNGTSSTQPVTITITGTNDAPVIAADASGTGGTNVHGLTETNAALTTSGALAVTDADVTNTDTASVFAISVAGTGNAGRPVGLTDAVLQAMMSVDADNVIDNTHTAGTIHWSFNSAPQAFDFLGAGQTLQLTYTIRATDSDVTHATGDQTVVVTITGTNDAPVLNANGGSLSYSENQAATAIDTALTASDVDNTTLASAKVSITGNFVSSQDTLGFTNQNGITGHYDSTTGIMTLTGTATVAQYQAALDSVTYSNSSDNPSGAIRTISYQVDDGQASNHASNIVTSTVAVTPVNDAPVAVTPAAHYHVNAGSDLNLQGAGLSVSDVDGNNGVESVTLTAGEGIFDVSAGHGVAASGDGTGSLTLSGTLADIQSFLDGNSGHLVYRDDVPSPHASTTLTLSINDNGHTGAGGPQTGSSTSIIDIVGGSGTTLVNSAPVAAPDSFKSVTSLGSLASTLTANDSDPDLGDTFAISGAAHGATAAIPNADGAFEIQGLYGTLLLFPTAPGKTVEGFTNLKAGDFIFLPGQGIDGNPLANNPLDSRAPDLPLTDTFTYTITDSHGAVSNPATLTLTFANTDFFTGTVGSDWADAGNWFDGTPIANEIAYIGAGKQVDLDSQSALPSPTTGMVVDIVGGQLTASGVSLDSMTFDVGNAGVLDLADGTTISNSEVVLLAGATLGVESVAGAALDGVNANESPVGSIVVGALGPSTLTLDDGTTITDGTLTIGGGSTLHIEAGLHSGLGATLDGVTVNDAGNVQVDLATQLPTTLTLDDGTTIAGGGTGTMVIGSSGTLDIVNGGSQDSNGADATLDGVAVTNNGTIDVDPTASGAILMLDDGTTITGATLDIGNSGEVYVQGSATLNHVTVANGNEIEIGTATFTGSTLILEGGTTISGGALALNEAGDTVVVQHVAGTLGPDATLDNVQVSDLGTIQVGTVAGIDPTLTLEDGTTITGDAGIGTLSIGSGDTLDIEAGAGNGFGATLHGITVNAADITSTINLGSGSTLTLQDTSVSGGTIAFTGTGDTLALDSASDISNTTITGFASGDVIDLTDYDPTTTHATYLNGVLTVSDVTHTTPKAITLSGPATASPVQTISDNNGGTDVVFDQAPAISGDLAVVVVKGNGVQLVGIDGTLTADLKAVDADSAPDHLTYTVVSTSLGHIASSANGLAISSFTQDQLNKGEVFFVADPPTQAQQGSQAFQGTFTVTLSDGIAPPSAPTTVGVSFVDAQIAVQTGSGYNFNQDGSIEAMGGGLLSNETATTFTITNADPAVDRDFAVTGSGFLYDSSGALTAGTINSIVETTHGTQTPLATFTLNVSAVVWMNAVTAAHGGDHSLIEALTSPWFFNFFGGGGDDSFETGIQNDIFTGNAGNDTLSGDSGFDRANYGNATAAIHVQLAAGKVTEDGTTDTDTLQSIELVTGSNSADTFNALGFGANSANAGSTVTANTTGLFNEFEGRGGNDIITGNGVTRISYLHATSGVTVTFDQNSWDPITGGATGTAVGDVVSTGTDTFSRVNSVRGSNFDDVFHGSNNPANTAENFEGMGGNDLIDGGSGFSRAVYSSTFDFSSTGVGVGVDVELAAGTVTDRAGGTGIGAGTDTLVSVEAVWGTDFADIYNASGFTTAVAAGKPNAGSSGGITIGGTIRAFNEFEGDGGNDTITGNGDTRVVYTHATAGVVVTLTNIPGGVAGAGTAVGNASVGTDTFTGGVNAVNGSEFNDVITGNNLANTLNGLNGNDVLDGGGAAAGTADVLFGGQGSDLFVYGKGYGLLTINDFDQGNTPGVFNQGEGDRLQLNGLSFAGATITQPTGTNNTVINFGGGDVVTLVNVSPAAFTANFGQEFLDWRQVVDPLHATQGSAATNATTWIVPNLDGLTSTVFTGTGFTYDATSHLPTGGTITSMSLVSNLDNTVMQTVTGLTTSLGALGNLISTVETIQAEAPWGSLINQNTDPLSFTATHIHLANSDGTFTDLLGSGFTQSGQGVFTGTVTSIEQLAANGTTVLQSANLAPNTSLTDVVSALSGDNLSREFYNLAAQGNTSFTGLHAQVGTNNLFYQDFDDTPGSHTFTGQTPNSAPNLVNTVDFGEATSGVTVNLAQHTASWGGFQDTLVNIESAFGSNFADTITGDSGFNLLDGRGAASGTHDTLTGGGGNDTFVFGLGYGAETITDFDQGNTPGTFNLGEGDVIQVNGFANGPIISYNSSTNTTTADFGNGDVLTLLNVNSTSLSPSNFFGIGNGNNGGGGSHPVLNSMTLTVSTGGTTVLTNNDFSVTDPGFTNFLYTVQNVTGGQFEIFQNGAFQPAPTGGFTTAQLAAGQVEFVASGNAAPSFSIQVNDFGNTSPLIAPTVLFNAQPSGISAFPAVSAGVHVFAPNLQANGVTNTLGAVFYTTTNYNPAGDPTGPYTLTQNALPLDPFLLPTNAGDQIIETNSVSLPARTGFILPSVVVTSGGVSTVRTEGIATYVTQSGGEYLINEALITGGNGPNGALNISSSTPPIFQIDTGTGTIEGLSESFRNDAALGSTPVMSTYSIVWDSYSNAVATSSGVDTIKFQIFNADGTASSPVETLTPSATVSSFFNTPAYQFRSGGGAYALAEAVTNTVTAATNTPAVLAALNLTVGQSFDGIQFTGFNLDGSANTAFTPNNPILPNLSAYAALSASLGAPAVNHITQENGAVDTQAMQALTFLQVSPNNTNSFFVTWNESVMVGNQSFDQVELAVSKPGTPGLIFRNVFQIADDDPQNVRLAEWSDPTHPGQDIVVLSYGDASATHLVEYTVNTVGGTVVNGVNTGGTTNVVQVASVTDPTTSAYIALVSDGDGRVEVTYDNVLDTSSQTSQDLVKVFDFRTSGVNINDSSLTDGQFKYVAGTHFNDTFTGENNDQNFYYFEGQDTLTSAPTDHFNGGANAWNVAVFADARANYTVSTVGGVTTVTNIDPLHAHAGTLIANANVEALAFNPTHDPAANPDGSIEASGDTLLILSPTFAHAATIDSGATLEFAGGDSGSVTFSAATGTLRLDDPTHFTGQISGLSGSDGIDLKGFADGSTQVVANSTTASTVLTVTDATHTVANNTAVNITLEGDYTHSTFAHSVDASNSGVLIVDPPAAGPGPMIMNDPGPGASDTILASAPNQALTGYGASNTFVFNFANIGQDTVTNFHAATDVLQFSSPLFANAQAALDATQDDGHGNTVITLDPSDTITIAGVLKTQLHVTDFHIV